MFESFSPQEQPVETKKEEIGGLEAWLQLIKATAVIEHFLETKQGEIRDVVRQSQEGTKNPLLIGDRILNTTSKFMKIVTDYRVETEQERANLRNDTIFNVMDIKDRAREVDEMGQQNSNRNALLQDILYGNIKQKVEEASVTDKELVENYNKIDRSKELSEEDNATDEAFKKRLEEQLREWRESRK